ncbi:hypothetical protein [Botryobacter ruber]|uniref:hypothetical protein n=1 Tax=Botryobacter ruber TaxID=2171629 RepID=UPI000E0A5F03|nr:hypothetical protein [Botryobacter ruber]
MSEVRIPLRVASFLADFKLTRLTRRTAFVLCLLLVGSSCQQEQQAAEQQQVTEHPAFASTNSALATPVKLSIEKKDTTNADSTKADTVTTENISPEANTSGSEWNYPGPKPLPGAILPQKRIVAFYGNLLSKRMGILGELPPDEMLQKLDSEVAGWEEADPDTPVQPALHAIVVTAQGQPGSGSKYRLRMTDKFIHDVLEIAKKRDAIVFLDVQVGQSTLQEELPRLKPFLQLPNVHLGIDAEFSMKNGGVPGKRIGTYDAADINYATGLLADLVTEHNIPPKILVVHRFTQRMITNASKIKLDERVQVVMHMDGWGHPVLKKDTYRSYIAKEPVQFTGFKLFYKNDTKNGSRLMTRKEILALKPKPLYIQYQ